MIDVALLVGGPSPERGISLNSARSVADHLESDDIAIASIIYFDERRQPFVISRALLYSNTPDDFDFKLSQWAAPLSEAALGAELQRCDLAFPVMHGEFGEDGDVQRLLEGFGVPYVGSAPDACAVAYDKYSCHEHLRAAGIATVPSMLVTPDTIDPAALDDLRSSFDPGESRLVLKPAAGGSSIGVTVSADATVLHGSSAGLAMTHDRMVAQPYIRGTEFTVVVVSGPNGPVSLAPVEVERRESASGEILSYKDKYLASDDVRYHCPPRSNWPDDVVAALRDTAERAFVSLGLRDFARIDCWVVGGSDAARVLVSDVNPISGMEQNSYLFIQASQLGMGHSDILRYVVSAACRRAGIDEPGPGDRRVVSDDRLPVAVLFGGTTAERQVSVLSGSNVWLKLLRSARFAPAPFLLADDGDPVVWELTYPVALRHSAEEIAETCASAAEAEARRVALAERIAERLSLDARFQSLDMSLPRRIGLEEFLAGRPFVFIALHGGDGENGTLQALLDERGIAYNGCGPEAAALCADKYQTSLRLGGLEPLGVRTARKIQFEVAQIEAAAGLWDTLVDACGAERFVVKPLSDGCSAGVVPLNRPEELDVYLDAVRRGSRRIEAGSFELLDRLQEVEMPTVPTTSLLFEQFIETDDIAVVTAADEVGAAGRSASRLAWAEERDTGWIEITVGVLGQNKELHAMSPSLTIARQGVLSVEEKFMGGTGVNITPPPPPPLGRVQPAALARATDLIERVAVELGIDGYARIDAFMQRDTGEVLVIEANTLPGLSPSTVLYHQALDEDPPMFPRELLERIIDIGLATDRQ